MGSACDRHSEGGPGLNGSLFGKGEVLLFGQPKVRVCLGTRSGLLRKTSVRVPAFVAALVLAFSLSGSVLAQTETSLRVAERLLQRTVVPLLDSLAVPKSEPLVVRVLPENREESWFVQTRLLRDLQTAGYQNVAVGESAGQRSARLTLRVDRLRTRLVPTSQRNRLARSVELQLSGMLLGSDGRTLWAGVLQKTASDTVSRADVPRLSESPYEFTYTAAAEKQSRVRHVLESVALAGAFGLITYLFYSYRSR